MAKKKPGKKKPAKSKARKGPTRTTRSAKKTSARPKTSKVAKKKARASTKKATSARPAAKKAATKSSTKKTNNALKQTTPAKKTSAGTSGAKAAAKPAKAVKPAPPAKNAASAKSTKGKTAATSPPAEKAGTKKGASGKKAAGKAPLQPDAQGYVIINGRRVRMISTKGLTIPKRAAAATDNGNKLNNDDVPRKMKKSKLTPKDLEYFRDLLLMQRRQMAGDLSSMESEALKSGGGEVSHMPIHMADIGTDTFDQDFMLGLAANERGLLKEIDDALARIESGEYGVCAATGNPIPKSRLNAKPWAKYTVEAARMIERGLNAG